MFLTLARLSTTFTNIVQRVGTRLLESTSNSYSPAVENLLLPKPGGIFSIAVRYNIRNHFPRPSERKRIKRHGWNKRMSTPGGQRIIMRRMLKGKHVLTH